MTETLTTRSAQAAMLIRKPAHEVFEAFVNPEITTKFWFTKSSGKLEQGKQVTWTWEMYDASTKVNVQSLEADKRILITWDEEDPTTIDWLFEPMGDDKTFVTITQSGFTGEGDKLVAKLTDASGGWALVLAGAKALIEYNIQLGLTADRFPQGK